MKKIAIDADGTVFRVMSLVCGLINLKLGTNYTYKDITTWDFWKDQGIEHEFWAMYDVLDSSDLRLNLRPYDLDTLDVLKQINQKIGQPIEILTCNSEQAADSIQQWFESWSERAPEVKVVCIGRQTSREKLELPYDIYLDDSPHMAEFISEYPKKSLLLLNAPWNQDVSETTQVRRIHRWKNVIPILNQMGAFPSIRYGEREKLIQKLNQPYEEALDDFYYS